jgi:hypothetical protein
MSLEASGLYSGCVNSRPIGSLRPASYLPRVTGPIGAVVVSSILLGRSSLGTSPRYNTKLIKNWSRNHVSGNAEKIKHLRVQLGRRKEPKPEITWAQRLYTERSGEHTVTQLCFLSVTGMCRQDVCVCVRVFHRSQTVVGFQTLQHFSLYTHIVHTTTYYSDRSLYALNCTWLPDYLMENHC